MSAPKIGFKEGFSATMGYFAAKLVVSLVFLVVMVVGLSIATGIMYLLNK